MTPNSHRNLEPSGIFFTPSMQVTGLPGGIEAARYEIEQHLLQRTGRTVTVELSMPRCDYTDANWSDPTWPYLDAPRGMLVSQLFFVDF